MAGGTITRIALGNSSTVVEGNFEGYYETLSMQAGKESRFKAKQTNHSNPKESIAGKHFLRGWWSSDEQGEHKIKEAFLGDDVYFHIETRDIPNGKFIATTLFDDDVKRSEEEVDNFQGSDNIKLGPKNGNDYRFLNYREVYNNKVIIPITLGGIMTTLIGEEEDETIELFFACSYEGENLELPESFGDYLKVKQKEPLIIYICGYWNSKMPYAGTEWGEQYWGQTLKSSAKRYFRSTKEYFINGAGTKLSSGQTRYTDGKEFAESRYGNIQSKFYQEVFKNVRRIMIVSHSMGAAFSEGVLSILKQHNVQVEKILHLSPADTSDFNVNFPEITYQIDIDWDPVLMYKNANDTAFIKGIKYAGLVKNPRVDEFGHMYTKEEAFVWKWFEDLELVIFNYGRSEKKYNRHPSDGLGPSTNSVYKVNIYTSSGEIHQTQFRKVLKNNSIYHYHGLNEYENYQFSK